MISKRFHPHAPGTHPPDPMDGDLREWKEPMQFTIAVLLGLILGFILLSLMRRARSTGGTPAAKPAWPGWLILALGAVSAVAFGAGFTRMVDLPGIFIMFVITLPVATVVLGVGSLIKGEHRWPI